MLNAGVDLALTSVRKRYHLSFISSILSGVCKPFIKQVLNNALSLGFGELYSWPWNPVLSLVWNSCTDFSVPCFRSSRVWDPVSTCFSTHLVKTSQKSCPDLIVLVSPFCFSFIPSHLYPCLHLFCQPIFPYAWFILTHKILPSGHLRHPCLGTIFINLSISFTAHSFSCSLFSPPWTLGGLSPYQRLFPPHPEPWVFQPKPWVTLDSILGSQWAGQASHIY